MLIDCHFSDAIPTALQEKSFDVVSAWARGWERESDERLLELAASEERAVLTNNVRDFLPLFRDWQAVGLTHFGIVLTSDRKYPRSKDASGKLIAALTGLMTANQGTDALRDRVVWL